MGTDLFPSGPAGRVRLYASVLLPAVLAVVAAVVWTFWSAGVDRDRIARTAGEVGLGNALSDAQVALGTKASYLLGLRGVAPDDVSGVYLPNLARTGEVTSRAVGRPQALSLLESAERDGARALDQLEAFGYAPSGALVEALSVTPQGVRALITGSGTEGLPLDSYERAYSELLTRYGEVQARSANALRELSAQAQTRSRWLQPGFLALGIGLLLFVTAAMTAVGWWVSRRIRRAEARSASENERAEALARRNARLLELVDASRRVTAGSDLTSVARAVADEARDILAAQGAAVLLLDDHDAAHPVASTGTPVAAPIRAQQGIVGRAMDTGLSTRAVVASDPAFPGATGPLSVVVAPLIAGRRVTGAIAVVAGEGALADDEDELTLRLISLAAATAIETAKAHDTTARLAETDALTGLANRRRLDGDLATLGDAVDGRVAFLMIDVDHFKAFNDTHGHPAGDALLRQLAETVGSCVRSSDIAYRFGGEEFAVLLRDAGPEEAETVAARIRSEVSATAFAGGQTQPGGRVTVSVGMSRGRIGDRGPDLLHRADAALYEAKRAGRDRVVVDV